MQTRNELLGFFPEIAAELMKLPDMGIDGERVVLTTKESRNSISSEAPLCDTRSKTIGDCGWLKAWP
jgi:hypothetical protein